MERRLFKRIAFGVKAEITVHGRHFQAVIEDLSETGANILTDPIKDASSLVEGAEMELSFQTADKENVVLNGTIQWLRQAYPKTNMYKIGMVLVNPPWDESKTFI